MTEQHRFSAFVKELTALSQKHGIAIRSTGGVHIFDTVSETPKVTYTQDASSGDIDFNLQQPNISEMPIVRFCRKPCDMSEVRQAANNLREHAGKVKVIETKEFTAAEYDTFINQFMCKHDWLTGKGGFDDDKIREVIQVVAPERDTLFIDPSGYNYARYVGLRVA